MGSRVQDLLMGKKKGRTAQEGATRRGNLGMGYVYVQEDTGTVNQRKEPVTDRISSNNNT